MTGCLSRIRVLDLSRVFSGPWAAQLLADFGADVIKVERPRGGDDVRQMGYRVQAEDGSETSETSSFIAMNRGKRSITVDISSAAGQALIVRLAEHCDILLENFKAGDLARYGLGYAELARRNPKLIYCSISGFGQSGPRSHLPGYDPIFQSMSGLMSLTGHADDQPGGGPQKVGYAVSDLTAGFYATAAMLAALHHRDTVSGTGQYIDLGMLDAQIAAISHMAMNYLVSGTQPLRVGTASQITCPYQSFQCSDGQVMIAVGNDSQFVSLCKVLGRPELPLDDRFATNPLRARHRAVLVPLLSECFARRSARELSLACDEAGVPCGPINDFEQVFDDPQVRHREVLTQMPHPLAGTIPVIANPIKFSDTPVEYRRPPPLLGEHTHEVLRELLGLGDAELAELAGDRVI
jgi:crotonobetainyl-CoA:carnitine CoA-transferase CaiB-like acyl-CoA transferase